MQAEGCGMSTASRCYGDSGWSSAGGSLGLPEHPPDTGPGGGVSTVGHSGVRMKAGGSCVCRGTRPSSSPRPSTPNLSALTELLRVRSVPPRSAGGGCCLSPLPRGCPRGVPTLRDAGALQPPAPRCCVMLQQVRTGWDIWLLDTPGSTWHQTHWMRQRETEARSRFPHTHSLPGPPSPQLCGDSFDLQGVGWGWGRERLEEPGGCCSPSAGWWSVCVSPPNSRGGCQCSCRAGTPHSTSSLTSSCPSPALARGAWGGAGG